MGERYAGGLGPSTTELEQRKELVKTVKWLQTTQKELLREKNKNKQLTDELTKLCAIDSITSGEEALQRNARLSSAVASSRKDADLNADEIRLVSRKLIQEERLRKNLEAEVRTFRKESEQLRISLDEAQSENQRLRAELGLLTQSHRFGHGRGSSLREAARGDDVAGIEKLLGGGADPNQDEDGEGRTAIFWAAQCGAVGSIRALAAGGADVRKRASHDAKAWRWRLDDPLTTACQCGQPEACRALLEANALLDINASCEYRQGDDQWFSCTPLLAACVAGQAEVVRVLLDFDASLNVRKDDGGGPLHCAVRADHGTEAVELLAQKKADLDLRDQDGWTPLLHAITLRSMPCVRVLMRAGASLEAAMEGYPQSQDLVEAIGADDSGMVCALIEAGTDVNAPRVEEQAVARSGSGMISYTPLCQAVRHRRRSCVDMLLDAKADVNLRSISFHGEGEDVYATPLALAAEAGDMDVLQKLLVNNADVNLEVQPETSFTALHAAVSAGQETAALALSKANADLNQVARMQGTDLGSALQLAQEKNPRLYELLSKASIPLFQKVG
eukprot:TRINITY_DN9230_c0_g1_i1.p1 TRINITY_DN9230_c0_g1~~TRINITY_DN9230_c0_g1_i1.p1  ORF type:complete len:582 (-),score=169.18 TRINITY_DN9230_c0_g1_i1:97-1779(-)